MLIKIYRCSDAALKDEIRSLTHYVLNNIKKKKVLKNVSISFYLGHKDLEKENAWGLCWWTDNNLNPRRFVIALNDKMSHRLFKKTIIHELIHVKQYLLGDLKDYVTGQVKWKTKIYDDSDSYKDYINTPWEKQAYHLSEVIYKKLYT